MDHTVPIRFSGYAGMDIGRDNGGVVDLSYEDRKPFAFTGTIKKVVFDIKPHLSTERRAGPARGRPPRARRARARGLSRATLRRTRRWHRRRHDRRPDRRLPVEGRRRGGLRGGPGAAAATCTGAVGRQQGPRGQPVGRADRPHGPRGRRRASAPSGSRSGCSRRRCSPRPPSARRSAPAPASCCTTRPASKLERAGGRRRSRSAAPA